MGSSPQRPRSNSRSALLVGYLRPQLVVVVDDVEGEVFELCEEFSEPPGVVEPGLVVV